MRYVKRQKYHHLDSQKLQKKYFGMDHSRYGNIQNLQGMLKLKAFMYIMSLLLFDLCLTL